MEEAPSEEEWTTPCRCSDAPEPLSAGLYNPGVVTTGGAGAGHSRTQVDRAGEVLRADSAAPADRARARAIVSDWRAQHRTPLVDIRTLLYQRMRRAAADGFVAQRLKRLSSVEAKLRRFPNMRLSRMQDIGGCRAVVSSVGEVEALDRICRQGKQAHELSAARDYLTKPKEDGYRGAHLVYRFRSQTAERSVWNGLRIEIQIRSLLQHAWATAVETVDVLRETRLKVGGPGNGDWKRFFALMGTVHAFEEGLAPVPETPVALAAVRSEVRELADRLGARDVLIGLAGIIGEVAKGSGWALLRLDASARRTTGRRYPASRFEEARREYLRLEEENEGDPAVQVCLVSTDSAETLRRAYPNYFLDVRLFVESLRLFLGMSSPSE